MAHEPVWASMAPESSAGAGGAGGPPQPVGCCRASSWRTWRRGLVTLLALVGLWHLAKPLIERLQGDAIGLVTIQGELTEAAPIVAAIERVQEDPHVKALVLRINSPGGDVAVAQEIAAAVKRARTARQLPVIASIGSIGASGGYYVALAADTIVAQPGSLTGSIGVLVERTVFGDALSRYGIRREVLKTGPYKDTGSPWRTWSAADRRMLAAVLDDMYQQFVAEVAAARRLPVARVRALADGRLFSGQQAQAAGLVDALGSLRDAITLAAQRAGLPAPAPRLVEWEASPSPWDPLRRLLQPGHEAAFWRAPAWRNLDKVPAAAWEAGG